jgi:hypothetical protein
MTFDVTTNTQIGTRASVSDTRGRHDTRSSDTGLFPSSATIEDSQTNTATSAALVHPFESDRG